MSVSLPSHLVYVVNAPPVKSFTATFQYNYFVPDEQVSRSGGVPRSVLEKPADQIDAAFTNYISTRTPRYVNLSWRRPALKDTGNSSFDTDIRTQARQSASDNNYVSDNLDRVISEDDFASVGFTSVTFHDGDIDSKVHNFVSGSYEALTTNDQKPDSPSVHKAAARLQVLLPNTIKPHFIMSAMTNSSVALGTNFKASPGGAHLLNDYMERLKAFYITTQISTKLMSDVTGRILRNPHTLFNTDVHQLHKYALRSKKSAVQHSNIPINEDEFRTLVPFVSLQVQKTAHLSERTAARQVGYIIDKVEIDSEKGTATQLDPIVINNPRVCNTIDPKVKYNFVYNYDIRSVSEFTLPALDIETKKAGTIKLLISSRPSNIAPVTTIDTTAPPPPTDLGFIWNYETNKILINWTFPPNPQRDIKKFQVFRRGSIDEPFQLLKEYDFDDSAVRTPPREVVSPQFIEYLTSPCSFYTDDDFVPPNVGLQGGLSGSDYIYAIAAIDAHALTSNYSSQFRVTFDVFANKLVTQLISHAGAPKSYPNIYVSGETFVDVMRVNGPNSKTMSVYFNPQYYMLQDNHGKFRRVYQTIQTNGSYKLHVINADNQKSGLLTITIDDRLKVVAPKLTYPTSRFGPQKTVPARIK